MTRTRHDPGRTPLMRVPTNAQFRAPFTMLTRSVPWDFFGTVNPTLRTTLIADTVRPTRRRSDVGLATFGVVAVDDGATVVIGIVEVVARVDVGVEEEGVEPLLDELNVVVVVEAMENDPMSVGVAVVVRLPMPNWPLVLVPQQRTPPLAATAHVCCAPDTTSTSSPCRLVICCRFVYPAPVHVTVDDVPRTQVCVSPADTRAAPDAMASDGVEVYVAGEVSTPSWPSALLPKQVSRPPVRTAQVCAAPAATTDAPAGSVTAAGVVALDATVVPRRPVR